MHGYLEGEPVRLYLGGTLDELVLEVGDSEVRLPLGEARELHKRLGELIAEYVGE